MLFLGQDRFPLTAHRVTVRLPQYVTQIGAPPAQSRIGENLHNCHHPPLATVDRGNTTLVPLDRNRPWMYPAQQPGYLPQNVTRLPLVDRDPILAPPKRPVRAPMMPPGQRRPPVTGQHAPRNVPRLPFTLIAFPAG